MTKPAAEHEGRHSRCIALTANGCIILSSDVRTQLTVMVSAIGMRGSSGLFAATPDVSYCWVSDVSEFEQSSLPSSQGSL